MFWWESEIDDCHDELMGVVHELNDTHYDRMVSNLEHLKVYSQRRYDLQDFRIWMMHCMGLHSPYIR
jgi:hypothetical protein